MIRTGRLILALLVTGLGALMMSSHGTTVHQAGAAGQYRLFAPQIGGDSSTGGLDPSAPASAGTASERAKSGLLTLADFPAGWKVDPTGDTSQPFLSPGSDGCPAMRGAPNEIGSAQASFSRESALRGVSAGVYVFPTPADAAIATYVFGAAAKCLDEATRSLPSDSRSKVTAKSSVLTAPPVGDQSFSMELTLTVTSTSGAGIPVDLFVTLTAIRVDSSIAAVASFSVFQRLDGAFLGDIYRKAAAKLN